MTMLDFPSTPRDGQVWAAPNGISYEWSEARGLWMQIASADPALGGSVPVFEDSRQGVYIVGNLPMTDTLPLPTHGARLFRRVFTASDPANQIDVDCDAQLAPGGTAISMAVMLFIDDQCVAAKVMTTNASWWFPVRLHWRGHLSAGPHTYEVRWSPQSGYGGNLGRWDGGRQLGGAINHLLTITEVTIGRKGDRGDKGPPGDGNVVLQARSVENTNLQTCSTPIPWDNTIPQISEGDEILSLLVTPFNAGSQLRIRATGFMSGQVQAFSLALFQSPGVDAIAASTGYNPAANAASIFTIEKVIASVSTDPRTISCRLGPRSGESGVTLNGNPTFGGVAVSTLFVDEVMP